MCVCVCVCRHVCFLCVFLCVSFVYVCGQSVDNHASEGSSVYMYDQITAGMVYAGGID